MTETHPAKRSVDGLMAGISVGDAMGMVLAVGAHLPRCDTLLALPSPVFGAAVALPLRSFAHAGIPIVGPV